MGVGWGEGHLDQNMEHSVNMALSPLIIKHTYFHQDKNWYDSILTDAVEHQIEASGKLLFLVELLQQAEQRNEKVIVFSQSLLTLDLIECFLSEEGDWTPGLDYYRLDGSVSADVRQATITEFNDISNSR